MPSDNVTPFRRPRPVRPQQQGGWGFKTHRGKAILVQFLTLLAFAINLLGAASGALLLPAASVLVQSQMIFWIIGMGISVAAALVALANRHEGMPWANTHHEHALRTLIIGYAIWTLGGLLAYIHGSLFIATIFIQLAVAIWAGVRALIGLVLAFGRKPIPNPRGWLV
ncbi:MAG: hypothetical protein JNL81_03415 [Hyphomonadaceae bacterium]|nr:hypothetical protein [Hyphomonadaceae bacterium]